MKVFELLEAGNKILKDINVEEYYLKTKMLLLDILNKSKEYLIINKDEEVNKELENIFFEKLELLKKNIPIQYIINKQEFYGYEFFVNENVLIPQPDTEILVEEVINYINSKIIGNSKVDILDLCTGSGIIGICLKKKLESKVCIYESDVSKNALEVAKKNAERLDADITFIESDLFEKINSNLKFDIIVSNPPYIKTDVIKSLSGEVKCEPFIALDGKEDGLYFYRKIIEEAKEYLNTNGILFFEIGYDQREEVENLFKENGYKNVYSKKDYSGNDRIVVGMKGE